MLVKSRIDLEWKNLFVAKLMVNSFLAVVEKRTYEIHNDFCMKEKLVLGIFLWLGLGIGATFDHSGQGLLLVLCLDD